MKSKKIIYWIGLGASMLAMFAWIFVAVALTGGREIEEFTPRDEKIMTGFIVVELLTMAVTMVFAVLLGREVGKANREKLQKMPPVKHPGRGIGWTVLMFLVYLGMMCCGIVAKPRMPEVLRNACPLILIGSGMLVAALLVLNIVLCNRLRRQMEQKSVAQMQEYLYSHREHAEQTVAQKRPLLARCRRWTAVYAIFLGLLGLASAFCAGVCLEAGLAGGLCMIMVAVLMCPVSRIRFSVVKEVFDENPGYVSRADYPELYAIADGAAEKLDCTAPIRILLSPDCGASIGMVGPYCMVQLGVSLLGILTGEELAAVMLHEFSHITGETRQTHKEGQYYSWLCGGRLQHFYAGFTNRMFSYSDMYYELQYALYRYAVSIAAETAADRAMLLTANPEAIATGLIKMQYYELYCWQRESWNEECFYEPEEPVGGMLAKEQTRFRASAKRYAPLWDELIEKELPSRSASHPTVSQRLKDLGLLLPRQVAIEAPVERLCAKALDHIERQLLEHVQKTYAENREKCYQEPLDEITAWEKEGKPVVGERYGDLIWALRQLGRTEEAIALCDRAIDTLPLIAAAQAYFIRGCHRLHGFDPAGIEDLYTAMEANANYLEEGLQVLGAFCCLTGNQEELDRYRQRAVELAQKHRDEDSHANVLQKKDRLSPEYLPEGMLENILQYIHSVGEDQIQRIYLVRKTITETFFTSVFVIEFVQDAKDARCDEILHRIFRYLDTCSDWQFSLFDRRDVKDVPLDAIENSCVFQKENE